MLQLIGQLLYHVLALGETVYGLYYDLFVVEFPETEFMWHDKFGGHFKFLTTQNMVIQTLYFLLAIINDIIGSNEPDAASNLPTIRLLRDHYFAGLSFPISILVTFLFWSLYFYKRDAVLPSVFLDVLPSWFNQMEHTAVSILALGEMLICFRAYPELGTGLTILYTYCIFYMAWLHVIKYYRGFWVYHLFKDFNPKERYIFLCGVLLIVLVIYLVGELINNAHWSKELNFVAYTAQTPAALAKAAKEL